MFSHGYCYGDNDVRGFKQGGVVKTAAQARRAIIRAMVKSGIPETSILFKESERTKGQYRAWYRDVSAANPTGFREERSNYIFFKLAETWALIDTTAGKKFVTGSGNLDDMKVMAREIAPTGKLKRCGDNILVSQGVHIVRIL